ncbi:FHA domain-containing protein FhaB/FipA [Compostimonas suwonensis]|uniref:Type III secretion system (T3SS) inner membrane Yop/YscD-like protein n=1 Tax=Compostimonas suwonensis TaxID=1048394 RepID=A0A2M9C418_9MICO|nr:FHA domain-containing protein [Compostimonas suwonensis]PJJ65274.1 type III secretion system (T3SS) inner membrane Yop/YscD-like protein [Compostimonas suwonensis]
MTSELTLLVLRIGFLILLWAFVFAIVYALRSDLFGQRVRKLQPEAAAAPAASASASAPAPVRPPQAPLAPQPPVSSRPVATTTTASRLVITSGSKEGMEIPLGREPLTIGRSSESGLVIRDDYTSTHHARLMLWNDEWMVQDLDSTNGTFLDGKRVTVPTKVPLNTPIKVGATSFELRR